MANVFVSHRAADAAVAEQLAADIRADGHHVWLDEWAIDIGDSIVEKINEGLEGSTYLVLCLSAHGSTTPWMSREWYSALARQLNGHTIRILPVRLSGAAVPAIIADFKYVDAAADYPAALTQLLSRLRRA
jgi:hypothetical protein